MTFRRLALPVAITAGLFALAWLNTLLPDRLEVLVSHFVRFAIFTLLLWLAMRALHVEALIVAIIQAGERDRTLRTQEIAAELARVTAEKAEEAARASEERHRLIGQKLDSMLANGHVKGIDEVEKKVDAVHEVVTETHQTVGHLKEELFNGKKEP